MPRTLRRIALELAGPSMRYAVYNPQDPRKGSVLPDTTLGQIILAEGETITKALAGAAAPPGSVVWDRKEARVAYVVPSDKA